MCQYVLTLFHLLLQIGKGVSAYFYGSLPVEQAMLLGALEFILSRPVEEAAAAPSSPLLYQLLY